MTNYNAPIEVIRIVGENSHLVMTLPLHSRFLDVREVVMNGKRGRPLVLMKGYFPVHNGYYAELFKNAVMEKHAQEERASIAAEIPTPKEQSHARNSKRL